MHTPFFHKYLALISRSNDILTVMCIQNFEELNYWGICLTTLEISHDARYICNFYIVKLLGIEVFRGKMRTCLDILLWWMRIDKTLQRISNLCTYLKIAKTHVTTCPFKINEYNLLQHLQAMNIFIQNITI